MAADKRILDELTRAATGAVGAVSSMREEVRAQLRQQFERVLQDFDLVPREEFDAVQEMASNARMEQERMAARLDALEAELADLKAGSGAKPTSARSSGAKAATASASGSAAPGSKTRSTTRTGAKQSGPEQSGTAAPAGKSAGSAAKSSGGAKGKSTSTASKSRKKSGGTATGGGA